MTIDAIKRIAIDGATPVVPPHSDYETVSADWTETEYRCFETAGGGFGGRWQGSASEVSFESWPYGEVCVLLSGRVAVIDAEGGRQDFVSGDAFFIPAGFSGRWVTLQPSEKIFVAIPERP